MKDIQRNYEIAREIFAGYGVDTEEALRKMEQIPISIHCWQLDDLTGFEDFDAKLTGGIATTGNAPGRPRSVKEYFEHMDKALSFIPGRKKVAIHATYIDHLGRSFDRDDIRPENYAFWVDYAKKKGIGLDFNPTYFSHEKAADNLTLSSPSKDIRDFWIAHGKASRKVGAYFGRELGEVCITNHWIPDGSKDLVADKVSPRERLIDSLDQILAEPIDRKYNIDSLESKLFGLGLESYTVGSHEFYMNYVAKRKNAIVCMDAGHFHPTESIAAKIPTFLAFGDELMLHVSRPVRWDSDHAVIIDEETKAIMQEIVRGKAEEKVHIGLDFFDASINRIAATVIGARAAKMCLLMALLEPYGRMRAAEEAGDFAKRLAFMEMSKNLPYGFVWDQYCEMHGVPDDGWFEKL